jgi:hypothetical protein
MHPTMMGRNSFMKIALLAAVAGLALYAPAANAAVNIYISETVSDAFTGVFAEAIGSLDTTGLSKGNQATLVPGARGTGTSYFFSGKNGATVDSYLGLAGPDAYGDTYGTGVSASSGTPFGFIMGGLPRVFLPTDYVSGAAIDSTFSVAYKTLLDLELTVGTYNYTLGRDTITLHVGEAAPAAVPEPASWMLMLSGFGAIGAAMRRRRKVAVSFG